MENAVERVQGNVIYAVFANGSSGNRPDTSGESALDIRFRRTS